MSMKTNLPTTLEAATTDGVQAEATAITETKHQTAVEAADIVRAAAKALLDQRKDVRAEQDRLVATVEELKTRPVSNQDAKQFIFDLIDQGAADFIEKAHWDQLFEMIAFPQAAGEDIVLRLAQKKPAPLSLASIDTLLAGNSSSSASRLRNANMGFFIGHPESSGLAIQSPLRFYFFFGDVIKAKVDQYFDEFYPRYGSASGEANPTDTLAERRDSIQQHQDRLSQLRALDTDIGDKLRDLGYVEEGRGREERLVFKAR